MTAPTQGTRDTLAYLIQQLELVDAEYQRWQARAQGAETLLAVLSPELHEGHRRAFGLPPLPKEDDT